MREKIKAGHSHLEESEIGTLIAERDSKFVGHHFRQKHDRYMNKQPQNYKLGACTVRYCECWKPGHQGSQLVSNAGKETGPSQPADFHPTPKKLRAARRLFLTPKKLTS
jgi:hypothetical protein